MLISSHINLYILIALCLIFTLKILTFKVTHKIVPTSMFETFMLISSHINLHILIALCLIFTLNKTMNVTHRLL